MEIIYQAAGILTVAIVILLFNLFLSGLLGVLLFRYRGAIPLPHLMLLCLKLFYSPLRSLLGLFCDPLVVDATLISTVNVLMENKFNTAGSRRMIFLPQCLRAPECKAKLDSRFGYVCGQCGACVISRISEAAKRCNYQVFVVPGDSFVKRIVKNDRPDAVIGVACLEELSMAMLAGVRLQVTCVGVPLSRSGCFCTDVNVNEVLLKMGDLKCSKLSGK